MGLSKLWGKDSSGAHGFVFSHIKAIYYNFSQNKLLSTKLDEMDTKDTETDNKIGNLSDLTTSVKSSVVAAITEVVSDMGDLSDLDSSVKTSLVVAINEALGNAQTAQNSVGTLSSLTTTAKGSAVAAINELNSNLRQNKILTYLVAMDFTNGQCKYTRDLSQELSVITFVAVMISAQDFPVTCSLTNGNIASVGISVTAPLNQNLSGRYNITVMYIGIGK